MRALLRENLERVGSGERFEQQSERMLRIDIDGGVWLKPGAVIAYRGNVRFSRRPTLGARSISDAAMRELAPLVRAEGHGRLYCAQQGSHVRILRIDGDRVFVTWSELLAFEESLRFDTCVVEHGVGVAAGGLIAVRLSGHGAAAIATHGEPLTLPVTPDNPVSTDPHATLAWSAELTPHLKTDLSWRSVFRHGGSEPVQMFFIGHGYVVVQPYEDRSRISLDLNPLDRIRTLLMS